MTKWVLNSRQRCDLEMLLNGGFYPLTGFLNRQDYENVLHNMRLSDGSLWPIPITLDVTEVFAANCALGDKIALFDIDNTQLAWMTIEDKWLAEKTIEAQRVFATEDSTHPGVSYLLNQANPWYLGGRVELVQMPKHYDFIELRHSPARLQRFFQLSGFDKIVVFQTRNPMHRAHMELTLRAAKLIQGHLLIHPVVGLTKPGDIDYFTRVRCYQKMLSYYQNQTVSLSLLPLAMRMGGPREALWHALIRKNYGCTHFIVGRDHAGPGNDKLGKAFYDPYEAQRLACHFQDEIGIKILSFQEMVYVKERKAYSPIDEILPDESTLSISGTQLRNYLHKGESIPAWFSFPEIIKELKEAYPPRERQGFTLFFTGLSGAGKTTLANAIQARLMSLGRRKITILDGDVIRHYLASELGFSKADRDLNIKRIGFVAAEVTKAGGVVICAAIAPYRQARESNRTLISQYGAFIEIYLSTSLQACEVRDTKGLYAKARKGELKGFTGIDDPYEAPIHPEITLDTEKQTIEESVDTIINFLKTQGYLTCEESISVPAAL